MKTQQDELVMLFLNILDEIKQNQHKDDLFQTVFDLIKLYQSSNKSISDLEKEIVFYKDAFVDMCQENAHLRSVYDIKEA